MAWVKCVTCGKLDKPDKTQIPHNVGTSTKMICPDCALHLLTGTTNAKQCRNCCPTGHGTRSE